MSGETELDIEAVKARRQAVKDANGFTEMYDAISCSYADIDALIAEVEALRAELTEVRRIPAIDPATVDQETLDKNRSAGN